MLYGNITCVSFKNTGFCRLFVSTALRFPGLPSWILALENFYMSYCLYIEGLHSIY